MRYDATRAGTVKLEIANSCFHRWIVFSSSANASVRFNLLFQKLVRDRRSRNERDDLGVH